MKLPCPIAVFLACLAPVGCSSGSKSQPTQQRDRQVETRPAEIQKVALITGHPDGARTAGAGAEGQTPSKSIAEDILRNMPVNSESRCVGITLVAAALLEGTLIDGDGCEEPAILGARIYEGALPRTATRFRAKLCVDEGMAPIQSREALEQLSTTVADLYKRRYFDLIATDAGRERLNAAMAKIVKSTAELDAVLDADPDGIDTFFCVGMRRFPDGTFKDTNHAILIAKAPTGERMVYDPNDPGAPIPCRLQDIDDGLEITWKCRYRDTGQVTTQRYHLSTRATIFGIALAREGTEGKADVGTRRD